MCLKLGYVYPSIILTGKENDWRWVKVSLKNIFWTWSLFQAFRLWWESRLRLRLYNKPHPPPPTPETKKEKKGIRAGDLHPPPPSPSKNKASAEAVRDVRKNSYKLKKSSPPPTFPHHFSNGVSLSYTGVLPIMIKIPEISVGIIFQKSIRKVRFGSFRHEYSGPPT